LHKDAAGRFQTFGEVRLEIDGALRHLPEAATPFARPRPRFSTAWRVAAWGLAGAAIIAGGLALRGLRATLPPAVRPVVRFTLPLPPGTTLPESEGLRWYGHLAVAPDGSGLVLAAERDHRGGPAGARAPEPAGSIG
jgi:hypothetical protein